MDVQLEPRDLRRIPNILWRRRWVVFLAVSATSLVALVGSYLTTPLYRATATLQIERHNPDILTFQELSTVDHGWGAYSDFYQTQYKILESETVVRGAVERLGLHEHPAFTKGTGDRGLLSRIRSLVPKKGRTLEVDPIDRTVRRIQGALEVAPVRNSQLVQVSWVSPDPDLAAAVANAVSKAFIHVNLSSKFSASSEATEFLVEQASQLRKEIGEIESELQRYGEAKGIVAIDQSNNTTLRSLQDVAQNWTEAQTTLARAKARYDSVRNSPPDALEEVMNSALINRLREEYAAYEAECTEKAKLFKDGWPELQTLQSKLDQAARRLELETVRIASQVIASSEAAYSEALEAVTNLDGLLKSRESAAQRLKRDAVEYENLQSEARKKRETLDALMKRQNEIGLSGNLRELEASSSNVRIVQPARPPAFRFRPHIKLNLLIGLMLGFSLGVGMAFLLEVVDNTVGSADDLKRVTSLPILAIVPAHDIPQVASKSRRKQPDRIGSIDLVAQLDTRTGASEAFRELRTSLLLSHPGQPPKLIMVTSALPEEGKTATAVNLAVVLAQLGRRVLVVDTDLRRPRLHKVFELENTRGISTFLSGLESNARSLIRTTSVDNLHLLSSGPIPPNPSELLNSPVFSKIDGLASQLGYEHVIFDSPPTVAVADPLIIAQSADASILVVRAGRTPRNLIRLAADKLEKAAAGTIGVVLNGVDPASYGGGVYKYQSLYVASDESAETPPASRAGGLGA